MYRIAERVARQNNCKAIINGESIGQVASQTLTSMNAIETVVDIPVIRPLACLDKLDIIEISESIDTYKTSILPYEDCCTIFVPTHPVINPDKKLCEEYETLYDFDSLVNDAIKNQEVIRIEDKNKQEYNSVL
jgi:thiamine biosynthesis protein ThiI